MLVACPPHAVFVMTLSEHSNIPTLSLSARRRQRLKRTCALEAVQNTRDLLEFLPKSFFFSRIVLDDLVPATCSLLNCSELTDDCVEGVCDYSFMEFQSPDPFGLDDSFDVHDLPASDVGLARCEIRMTDFALVSCFRDATDASGDGVVATLIHAPQVVGNSVLARGDRILISVPADNHQQQQLEVHHDDYYDEDFDDDDDDNDYNEGLAVHMSGIEVSVADFGPGTFVDMPGIEISVADFGPGAFVEDVGLARSDITMTDFAPDTSCGDGVDAIVFHAPKVVGNIDLARNAISGSCEDLAASVSKPERLDEFDKNGSCEDLAASVSVDDDGGSMALGILPNLFQFLSEVGALSLLQAVHEFDLTKTISSVSQLSEHHVCLNRFAPEFVLWMSDVKPLEVLAARVDDSFDEWMNEIAVESCCSALLVEAPRVAASSSVLQVQLQNQRQTSALISRACQRMLLLFDDDVTQSKCQMAIDEDWSVDVFLEFWTHRTCAGLDFDERGFEGVTRWAHDVVFPPVSKLSDPGRLLIYCAGMVDSHSELVMYFGDELIGD